jgi:hypothetical protein
MQQTETIRQLVLDSQYAIDAETVAEAIIARALTRRLVPGMAFRNDLRPAAVRSAPAAAPSRRSRPGALRAGRVAA